MTNTPPFAIGQRVVAIENHSQGIFKKGDEVVVKDMKLKCCGWALWYGMVFNLPKGYDCIEWPCSSCGVSSYSNDPRCFFSVKKFAPISENRERIKYVAVSETLREKAVEVVLENCKVN